MFRHIKINCSTDRRLSDKSVLRNNPEFPTAQLSNSYLLSQRRNQYRHILAGFLALRWRSTFKDDWKKNKSKLLGLA